MDHREQRKRAFSQAFQRINQPKYSDHNLQPAKRILSYLPDAMGLHHQDYDQENEAPMDLDSAAAFDEAPGTQMRHSVSLDLQYADPVLHKYASIQYGLSGSGQEPELEYEPGSSPPPLMRERQPLFPARHNSLPTPSAVRGQSMFGPSPYVRPDLGSSLGPYAQSGNDSFPMSDTSTAVGPLTPTALNFGNLSLNGEGHSISSSPLQCGSQGSRATVRVVTVSSFARHFSEFNPNEIVILFDKGKSLVKADKYPLCSASRVFALLLDGPFLDHGLTRCIRLRGDFPYAITTLFHFIETGNYMFDERAFAAYPLLTALDFHVHTYLAGGKYGLAAFRDHAINTYVGIAEHELRLGFLVTSGDQLSDAQTSMPGFPVMPPPDARANSEGMITPIDRFLNSLVLLWKNTNSRLDALRKAALELIKRHFAKLLRVPFFVTLLQEIAGFGDDIVASLGDDGFEVKAFQVPPGKRVNQTIRFEV